MILSLFASPLRAARTSTPHQQHDSSGSPFLAWWQLAQCHDSETLV